MLHQFWFSFGVLSLLLTRAIGTLKWLDEAQHFGGAIFPEPRKLQTLERILADPGVSIDLTKSCR
jgi:hypothetical protein